MHIRASQISSAVHKTSFLLVRSLPNLINTWKSIFKVFLLPLSYFNVSVRPIVHVELEIAAPFPAAFGIGLCFLLAFCRAQQGKSPQITADLLGMKPAKAEQIGTVHSIFQGTLSVKINLLCICSSVNLLFPLLCLQLYQGLLMHV